MPSFWDYVHIGRTTTTTSENGEHPHHNLQEGLFQIASQTCSILVQVNNTNNICFGNNTTNIQYNNFHDGNETCFSASTSETSATVEREQRIVLIPPEGAASDVVTSKLSNIQGIRRDSRAANARKLFSNYKHRLSTVLEGNNPTSGEDDFELWDHSQMLRSEQNNYKWHHSAWCKPSCIPITVILTLIVLVVLLPLLEHANERYTHARANGSHFICTDICRVQLVESIPEGLVYPDGSPQFLSTYDAWTKLIALANSTLDIGSFYWTLRGSDVYNHSTAWQGEKIFQSILTAGLQNKIKIRIAQSAPTQQQPNFDTEFLIKRKVAEVRSVDFSKLFGAGYLHTKLWIVDGQHFYLGSANMDWRALTQIKELGVLVTNCTCLAKDITKIFSAYWIAGRNNTIPHKWPEELSTKFNLHSPLRVNYNQEYDFETFFSSSPPQFSPRGRSQDLDAIIDTILHAEKFVHISVMDYFPLTIYTPTVKYWPYIDDALRTAAVQNKVSVKLLISWWNHSSPSEDYFLRSLESIANSYRGVDLQVKRFLVPSTDDQAKIPFGRVNHNKYMVTDNTAYIGTSNWSGDYFIDTAGIGLILRDPNFDRNETQITIRDELVSIFERDWNSVYAVDLKEKD